MILKIWRKLKSLFNKKETYTFTPKDPNEWLAYIIALRDGKRPTFNAEVEKALIWIEKTGSTRSEAIDTLQKIIEGIIIN